MKKLWLVIVVGVVTTIGLFADQPAMPGIYQSRNTATTTIPTTYGSTSVVTGLTALNQKTHIQIANGSTTKIAVSLNSQLAACTDGIDNAFVPASGAISVDNISIGSRVCLRSLGSAITSDGSVDISVW